MVRWDAWLRRWRTDPYLDVRSLEDCCEADCFAGPGHNVDSRIGSQPVLSVRPKYKTQVRSKMSAAAQGRILLIEALGLSDPDAGFSSSRSARSLAGGLGTSRVS